GVAGPASARMSSTVTLWAPARRSGRSASLTGSRCRQRSWLAWLGGHVLRRPRGRPHARAGTGPYLRDLGELVDLCLESRRDRVLVPDQPEEVVDGAGGGRQVAGL